MAGVSGLVGTFLGVETAPIRFERSGVQWSVKASDFVDMAAEGVKGLNPNADEPLHLDHTGHPAADRFALARASRSRVRGARPGLGRRKRRQQWTVRALLLAQRLTPRSIASTNLPRIGAAGRPRGRANPPRRRAGGLVALDRRDGARHVRLDDRAERVDDDAQLGCVASAAALGHVGGHDDRHDAAVRFAAGAVVRRRRTTIPGRDSDAPHLRAHRGLSVHLGAVQHRRDCTAARIFGAAAHVADDGSGQCPVQCRPALAGGPVSADADQAGLPPRLPVAARLPHEPLAGRRVRCIPDGTRARRYTALAAAGR